MRNELIEIMKVRHTDPIVKLVNEHLQHQANHIKQLNKTINERDLLIVALQKQIAELGGAANNSANDPVMCDTNLPLGPGRIQAVITTAECSKHSEEGEGEEWMTDPVLCESS